MTLEDSVSNYVLNSLYSSVHHPTSNSAWNSVYVSVWDFVRDFTSRRVVLSVVSVNSNVIPNYVLLRAYNLIKSYDT